MKTLSSLSDRQQTLLRLILHSNQGLTLDQLAKQLDISRNAVMQHIACLEKQQCIDTHMLPSSGGRPCRAYILSDTGRALFPKQYALFSSALLKTLGHQLDKQQLESVLHTMGQELAEPFKARVNSSSNTIEEIQQVMEELGYETSQGSMVSEPHHIIAKNCVFHDLAMENESICVLDRALISSLLGTQVEQSSCMAKGDDNCQFCPKH